MQPTLEVLFAPAEFETLATQDLSKTVCVVFDIFRATSTIVTALANGAAAIFPVAEISDALTLRRQTSEMLLAGEREGLRIRADLAEGIDFDFGNSPREFTPERVHGEIIALTTTNGSRALRACMEAKEVLVGSFLNLGATGDYLQRNRPSRLLLVCSGTGDQTAYEDVLGAGALIDQIGPEFSIADSARIAWECYRQNQNDLLTAATSSRNGRRLQALAELRDDLPWCLQRDRFPLVAKLSGDAIVSVIVKGHSESR